MNILNYLDNQLENYHRQNGNYPNIIIINSKLEKKIFRELKQGSPKINNCWIEKKSKNYRGIDIEIDEHIKMIKLR